MKLARATHMHVDDTVGDLARRMFGVELGAVAAAAKRQTVTGEKIGECLVALGALAPVELDELLAAQADMRSGKPVRALAALDRVVAASSRSLARAVGRLVAEP